ncbi:LIM/homeobox protein Lhx9-like isoform X2 [Liolophura sinensis]|uniref:LIM/homeobox protein Lhx9-like isoform X2 n=1 Tax=Liolophura sinensis TaxID=3198878 RepID=UPI0031599470
MVEKTTLTMCDRGTMESRTVTRVSNHPHSHPHPHPHPPERDSSRTMTVVDCPEEPSRCAGCAERILDRYYLLAVDKQWHVQCLRCCECKLRLESELTCFSKDGNIYCKDDYYRFAVKRCARCHLGISANELVMRAKELVYHLNCFTCASCNKTLTTGDHFGMKESLVYCRSHYELLFQGEFLHSLPPSLTSGHVPFYNGVAAVQKGRPRKRKNSLPGGDDCASLGLVPTDGSDRSQEVLDRDAYPQPPPRQKRVRTSFKHHQLRTMKSYFALNHNPDAKDLKQLAQKTGLSKRVLQVWFQNARAKYRRNLIKLESDRGGLGGDENAGEDGDCVKDSMGDMASSPSPSLSEISSSPSLSDLHSSTIEPDQSSNSLPDLFTSSIASIN